MIAFQRVMVDVPKVTAESRLFYDFSIFDILLRSFLACDPHIFRPKPQDHILLSSNYLLD